MILSLHITCHFIEMFNSVIVPLIIFIFLNYYQVDGSTYLTSPLHWMLLLQSQYKRLKYHYTWAWQFFTNKLYVIAHFMVLVLRTERYFNNSLNDIIIGLTIIIFGQFLAYSYFQYKMSFCIFHWKLEAFIYVLRTNLRYIKFYT